MLWFVIVSTCKVEAVDFETDHESEVLPFKWFFS